MGRIREISFSDFRHHARGTAPASSARCKGSRRLSDGAKPPHLRCAHHDPWKTTTFVAGLRNSGMVAPMVLDGPINGIAFQAYVDEVPAPDRRPGDDVGVDNLGSHKRHGIRASIEAAGATLLYLPPYSPDFNPIENAFATLNEAAPELTRHGLKLP